MVNSTEHAGSAAHAEHVMTFDWRGLRFHVVTPDPMSREHVRLIERALGAIASVGRFADLLGMIYGRHVRIRTERPSADVRFEVGR